MEIDRRCRSRLVWAGVLALSLHHGAVRCIHALPAAGAPDDPLFSQQWHLARCRFPEAWEIEPGSPQTVIAIIDTGADLTHPDLIDKLVPGLNLLEPGQPPQDRHNHGTAMAGIAAASTGNGLGIAGAAGACRVMPIRAIGVSSQTDEPLAELAFAWAIEQRVAVISCSWVVTEDRPSLRAAVEAAEAAGVLVVCGTRPNRIDYPAAYPTTLAIGSSSRADLGTGTYASYIDVVAPGQEILATLRGGQYLPLTGESYAVPVAAAACALMRARYPHLAPAAIRQRIRDTAADLHQPGWDARSGFGRIDVAAALVTSPTITAFRQKSRSTIELEWTPGWPDQYRVEARSAPEGNGWIPVSPVLRGVHRWVGRPLGTANYYRIRLLFDDER